MNHQTVQRYVASATDELFEGQNYSELHLNIQLVPHSKHSTLVIKNAQYCVGE